MNAPTMYPQTTRWDVRHVPIDKVLMTSQISAAVKSQGGSVSGMGFKGDPSASGFKLSRMDGMMEAFSGGEKLPPMHVKQVHTASGGTYYSVQDGRHRFAASIVTGKTHVPCVFDN